jgi:hypothetical protein
MRPTKSSKKYQETTYEQLRHDSQARVAFIDKIAAPVLNKMFECGLIP